MKVPSEKHANKLAQTLAVSLVAVAFAGGTTPSKEALASELGDTVSTERTVQNKAFLTEEGKAEEMYRLAMLHIEGSIAGADYEYGVELLKTSANRGNKDAERMSDFMENAFSGEGC